MTAIVSASHEDVPIRPWRGRILPYCLLTPAVLATLVVVFLPMVEAIVTSLYDFILWKPALPSVVIALVWRWIYDPNTGILNELLLRLHIIESAVPWLADPDKALYAIIATLTWQGFPFFAVMILAGLQSIPENQYEAAAIDGAGTWQQFRHVTLPGISGILATAGLLRIIWVANSVDVIFVMTGGGPGYATFTLPLYAFVKARQNLDFGYGTAIAVTFSLLLAGVVALYIARSSREVAS